MSNIIHTSNINRGSNCSRIVVHKMYSQLGPILMDRQFIATACDKKMGNSI